MSTKAVSRICARELVVLLLTALAVASLVPAGQAYAAAPSDVTVLSPSARQPVNVPVDIFYDPFERVLGGQLIVTYHYLSNPSMPGTTLGSIVTVDDNNETVAVTGPFPLPDGEHTRSDVVEELFPLGVHDLRLIVRNQDGSSSVSILGAVTVGIFDRMLPELYVHVAFPLWHGALRDDSPLALSGNLSRDNGDVKVWYVSADTSLGSVPVLIGEVKAGVAMSGDITSQAGSWSLSRFMPAGGYYLYSTFETTDAILSSGSYYLNVYHWDDDSIDFHQPNLHAGFGTSATAVAHGACAMEVWGSHLHEQNVFDSALSMRLIGGDGALTPSLLGRSFRTEWVFSKWDPDLWVDYYPTFRYNYSLGNGLLWKRDYAFMGVPLVMVRDVVSNPTADTTLVSASYGFDSAKDEAVRRWLPSVRHGWFTASTTLDPVSLPEEGFLLTENTRAAAGWVDGCEIVAWRSSPPPKMTPSGDRLLFTVNLNVPATRARSVVFYAGAAQTASEAIRVARAEMTRPVLKLGTPRAIRAGSAVRIAGKLTPVHPGATVRIVGRGVDVTAKCAADGRFSRRIVVRRTTRLRAVWSGDGDHPATAGEWIRVLVLPKRR